MAWVGHTRTAQSVIAADALRPKAAHSDTPAIPLAGLPQSVMISAETLNYAVDPERKSPMMSTFAQSDLSPAEQSAAQRISARFLPAGSAERPGALSPQLGSGPLLPHTRRILERALGVSDLWQHWEDASGHTEAP